MRRFLLASIAVIATLSGANPSDAAEPSATTKTAIFAGGCFWCMQPPYDQAKISYDQLLDIFWRQINPTQADGQFHDIGLSYQAAIFYSNDEEKKAAETSKEKLDKSGRFQKPIVTEILPAMKFYPAEEYHQRYYLKNPADFEAYHVGSGRVSFLAKVWK